MTFTPTFVGFIPETQDALLLLQAVIEGRLDLVTSRPPDNERNNMIRSGAVYIFKEGTIKRWTDKVCWSPSRVLGNFLIYRELRSKRTRPATNRNNLTPVRSNSPEESRRDGPIYNRPNRGRNVEFSLYGSLVDSYDFKEDGLVKKTISTTYAGETYRLISYYTVEDVQSHKLLSPMEYPALVNIEVDSQLATGIQFQMPLHNIAQVEYLQESRSNDMGHEMMPPSHSRQGLDIPHMGTDMRIEGPSSMIDHMIESSPDRGSIDEGQEGSPHSEINIHYDSRGDAVFYTDGAPDNQMMMAQYDLGTTYAFLGSNIQQFQFSSDPQPMPGPSSSKSPVPPPPQQQQQPQQQLHNIYYTYPDSNPADPRW